MVVTREITPEFRKETNRLFYMCKGHLIPDGHSPADIFALYNKFLKRVWYNSEAYEYEEGFEAAYRKKIDEKTDS